MFERPENPIKNRVFNMMMPKSLLLKRKFSEKMSKQIEFFESFGTDLGWFGADFGTVWEYFRDDFGPSLKTRKIESSKLKN